MGDLKRQTVLCFTCNADVTSGEFHAIFYTFLRSTGSLLADVIVKNLILNDLADLSSDSPVICHSCCNLFEDLCESAEKAVRLRDELWTLYKSSIGFRKQELGDFIRGTAVQTDNFEDILSEDDAVDGTADNEDTLDNADVKAETEDAEEKKWNENEEVYNSAKELITVDVDPQPNSVEEEEKWPRWKRRPVSCKVCGKWLKTKAFLQEHMQSHKESNEEIVQDEDEPQPQAEKKGRKSLSSDKKLRNSSEHKISVKTSKTPCIYSCRVCGKELKSKTGAIYHAKSHAFQVSKNFELDEVFLLKSTADVSENGCSADGESADQPSGMVTNHSELTSSSEDELPLSKRRKEFLFEKIQQEVQSDDAELKIKLTTQRKALQTLRKFGDVQVTKISKSGSEQMSFSDEISEQDHTVVPSVENFENEEVHPQISEVTHSNQLPLQKGSESKTEVPALTGYNLSGLTVSRRGRPRRKMPLTTLLKLKERKKLFAPREPRFKCDICGKMWKTKGELNSHRSTHSHERPYICEICGQAYKHKPALDVHVGMHRGIYQHQCPYCQKAFTQKGALQRHLPIHTGDLPFQCELCGKRFVHRTSFSIHTMAHTGVRNIRCEVCNMGVLSKSHLRRHMRIHSGEKPYECSTCGKAFAERYNLVAHQRIHDPTLAAHTRTQKRKPQSCRLCNAVFDRRPKLEDHMVTAHNKIVENQQQQQQQQQNTRNSGYDNSEVFVTPRFLINESATSSKSDSQTSTGNVKREEQPSVDLSMRGVHGFRNIDILRSTLDPSRGLELIRMANGMVETPNPWTYINPTT